MHARHPLAAGALASQGILLQAALAVFISLSTVIVAANAMLMRNARPTT
ncbi:MAG: hypothetical protein HY475_01335 [Candidatus Terrybacteria bacterium]|nr:hypothetical protein [Candidatus Terrybacteria bacterium]